MHDFVLIVVSVKPQCSSLHKPMMSLFVNERVTPEFNSFSNFPKVGGCLISSISITKLFDNIMLLGDQYYRGDLQLLIILGYFVFQKIFH